MQPPTPEQKNKAVRIKTKTIPTGGDDERPNVLGSLKAAMTSQNPPSWAYPNVQETTSQPETEDTRGKSRHPDYVRVGVVLHKDTKKIASRLWEDAEPKKDLSDLIEILLRRYIAEQRQ